MADRNSVFEPALLLGNQIFNFLREQIIAGDLKEGSRLNELGLQKTFKTSRSPIREAFRRLEAEGLVEIMPRKGAFVRSICMEDLREAAEVRSCLEGKALRLATNRITQYHLDILSQLLHKMDEKLNVRHAREYTILHNEFHKALVATCGNQYLMRVHSMVTEPFVTERLTYMCLSQLARAEEDNHGKLYELLCAGETIKASHLVEAHVSSLISDPAQIKGKPKASSKTPETQNSNKQEPTKSSKDHRI